MSTLDKWEQSHNFDEFTDFQIVEMLDEAAATKEKILERSANISPVSEVDNE